MRLCSGLKVGPRLCEWGFSLALQEVLMAMVQLCLPSEPDYTRVTSLSDSFQRCPVPKDCSPCRHHLWRASTRKTPMMTLSFRRFCPERKAPPHSRTPVIASR